MTILTLCVLGKSALQRRKPIDYNLWAKDNEAEVHRTYAAEVPEKRSRMDLKKRTEIAQRLFSQQSQAVKEAYKALAIEQHEKMKSEWEARLQNPASADPASRQACVTLIMMIRP